MLDIVYDSGCFIYIDLGVAINLAPEELKCVVSTIICRRAGFAVSVEA